MPLIRFVCVLRNGSSDSNAIHTLTRTVYSKLQHVCRTIYLILHKIVIFFEIDTWLEQLVYDNASDIYFMMHVVCCFNLRSTWWSQMNAQLDLQNNNNGKSNDLDLDLWPQMTLQTTFVWLSSDMADILAFDLKTVQYRRDALLQALLIRRTKLKEYLLISALGADTDGM